MSLNAWQMLVMLFVLMCLAMLWVLIILHDHDMLALGASRRRASDPVSPSTVVRLMTLTMICLLSGLVSLVTLLATSNPWLAFAFYLIAAGLMYWSVRKSLQ